MSWCDLPMLVLAEILDKLKHVIDRLCFSAVCKDWNTAYNCYRELKKPTIPMLMIPTKLGGKLPVKLRRETTQICGGMRSLYSVVTKSLLKKDLEVPYDRRFCGSCYGWLAALDQDQESNRHLIIRLISPYLKGCPTIKLPKLECTTSKYHEYTIRKLILTSDPAVHEDYTVVVCFSAATYGRLAIFNATHNCWAYKKDSFPPHYSDAIVHKDTVYVVGLWQNMVSFCLKDPNWPPKFNQVSPRTLEINLQGAYLVETSKKDRVLLIHRSVDMELSKTFGFKVFSITFDEKTKKLANLVEMKDLDGDTLFLGTSYSTAISASKFPQILKPNCIYFTNLVTVTPRYGHSDIGIFSLEDQSFSQHYKFKPKIDGFLPPSIWSIPLH